MPEKSEFNRTPSFFHSKGTSLHRQLFLVLRDQIMRGVIPPGGALPKEQALCEQFNVSRITVRRALADLDAVGLVVRRQGVGARVSDQLPVTRLKPNISLIDSLRASAMETEVKVLEVKHLVPPPEVAAMLQLSPGQKAVHTLRLRNPAGGPPTQLIDSWIPMPFGRKVTVAALKRKPLYKIITDQGVHFGRVVQEISAIIADPVGAGLLQTEVGAPLLCIFRLLHDTYERPVQFFQSYILADRSRILMEIPAAAINTLGAGQVVTDGHLSKSGVIAKAPGRASGDPPAQGRV